jgi:hypothetical protein
MNRGVLDAIQTTVASLQARADCDDGNAAVDGYLIGAAACLCAALEEAAASGSALLRSSA